jgi:hypothetical protein
MTDAAAPWAKNFRLCWYVILEKAFASRRCVFSPMTDAAAPWAKNYELPKIQKGR